MSYNGEYERDFLYSEVQPSDYYTHDYTPLQKGTPNLHGFCFDASDYATFKAAVKPSNCSHSDPASDTDSSDESDEWQIALPGQHKPILPPKKGKKYSGVQKFWAPLDICS